MDETTPPVVRFYETINLQDTRGFIVQERRWSDGAVEYWTIVGCPILEGPARGRTVSIWAQLPATSRVDAFANYTKFVDDQEESLQKQVYEQLKREDAERRGQIFVPPKRRPKIQGPGV